MKLRAIAAVLDAEPRTIWHRHLRSVDWPVVKAKLAIGGGDYLALTAPYGMTHVFCTDGARLPGARVPGGDGPFYPLFFCQAKVGLYGEFLNQPFRWEVEASEGWAAAAALKLDVRKPDVTAQDDPNDP